MPVAVLVLVRMSVLALVLRIVRARSVGQQEMTVWASVRVLVDFVTVSMWHAGRCPRHKDKVASRCRLKTDRNIDLA